MGILLALGIAAGVIYWTQHHSASSSPPGTTLPGTRPPGPGPDPTPQPPPSPAPPPPGPRPPGVYPAGTVGTYPITVSAVGGDMLCTVKATPGGSVTNNGQSQTFWYGPGTWVVFEQSVDTSFLGGIGTAFDHWEGPGVSSRDSTLRVQIQGAGFVRGVFAFFGVPGV